MKNLLLIVVVLLALFSCKKSTTAPKPVSTTSQIKMVTYSPVFPYYYQYTTQSYPTIMEDTAATQNLSVTYTVTNGSKHYITSVQDVSYNQNTTADSFRVSVYINGVKKYYNAGKHAAQVQFSL